MDANAWAVVVADSLSWEQAHLALENTVTGLPREKRGERAPGMDRSVWEILEHIRIAQRDLLDFCVNPDYRHDLDWPSDYWPESPAPADDAAWSESLASTLQDRVALAEFTISNAAALSQKIPHGTGQTWLRTVLVALDHTAYHTAQIVAVRRLIGAWPPEPGSG